MEERHKRIYEILNNRGNATVKQLTGEVFASEATIRRDLVKMEQQGLLVRVWGGAVSATKVNCDSPVFVRSAHNLNAKKKIARSATLFMRDNMTLFLPSGTTVTEFSKLLNHFENLTVFTTGMDIVTALRNHLSLKLVILGGELYEHYDFVGPLTGNNIDKFQADLLVFSCSGITAEGFSSKDNVRLDIIEKMHKNSTGTILLADTSKVGKTYTYKGFGFDSIDYVVMEKPPQDKGLMKALGNKLITPLK